MCQLRSMAARDGAPKKGSGCYHSGMDDQQFQRVAETSLQQLKRALIKAEESVDMEVEEQSGALHISFDEPPGRFVISPNSAVRQIWISALSTSFKLDWAEDQKD